MKIIDGGILIEPEDIPALMGAMSGFVEHISDLEGEGRIPGSFQPAVRMMTGSANQFMKLVESR